MTHYLKFIMASSVAMVIGLSGCGGGGGSGLVSTPPPPPPPVSSATVSAPASPIVPNASLFPAPTSGGPTIQAHSNTLFPLLQTAVSTTTSGATAAVTTMNGGGTLEFGAPGTSVQLDVGNAQLGVSNAVLNVTPQGSYEGTVGGGAVAMVAMADPATSNLSWTTYGFWAVEAPNRARTESNFVTGYRTPTASVPNTGSATYVGSVTGTGFRPAAGGLNGLAYYNLTGSAQLVANFASGAMTGSLDLVSHSFEGDTNPFNTVSLVGAISGGDFTGTTAVTSAPAGALASNATGTFAGMFFGPNAQELGAVWTLFDGTASAMGSLGATTAPSGAGKWDY